jgi:hypothetical protein
MGYSKDDLLDFVVTQLRRFKPQVVVAHDFEGEYGHGMHLVYADLVAQALELTNNAQVFPDSAAAYGTWDVSKAYFHLYQENPIVLDLDTPLESLDGLTPFQVAQERGFPCHVSQHVHRGFMNWLYGLNRDQTLASQIDDYNPAYYGLFRSTVGEDVHKNDFLENITSYAEQERLEAERLEQERLEAERQSEAERQEAERLEQERQDAEKAAEESRNAQALQQKKLEEQRQAQLKKEQAEDQKRLALTITALALIAISAGLGLFFTRSLGNKRKGS